MKTLKGAIKAALQSIPIGLGLALLAFRIEEYSGGFSGVGLVIYLISILAVVPFATFCDQISLLQLGLRTRNMGLKERRKPVPNRLVYWGQVSFLICSLLLSRSFLSDFGFIVICLSLSLLLFRTAWGIVGLLRSFARQTDAVRESVARLGNSSVLYMGRREGGLYQIEQWIAVISQTIGVPLVVVRHEDALKLLGAALPSSVPILMCRSASDLDSAFSLKSRAVFYVNSVTTNSAMVGYTAVKHVYLGHGDSDKEISAHRAHRMYDKIFVAGQAAVDRYRDANIELISDQIEIVGRPQLRLVTKSLTPKVIKNVLYAPTWSGYNQASSLSSLDSCIPFLEELIASGVSIAFRPHPLSFEISSDRAIIARIDALLKRCGKENLLSYESLDLNIYDQFNRADALICDISSLLIDFLPSRKPIAIIDCGPSKLGDSYPTRDHAITLTDPPSALALIEEDMQVASRLAAESYYLGSTELDLFRGSMLRILESKR